MQRGAAFSREMYLYRGTRSLHILMVPIREKRNVPGLQARLV